MGNYTITIQIANVTEAQASLILAKFNAALAGVNYQIVSSVYGTNV